MAQNVIFISYRRGPDSAVAGRLHDRLQAQLKNTHLFMDVTDMPLGSHFVDHIREQVSQCHALIAIIGPGWMADISRLSDKGDFVRLEIEAALNRGDIPVIPVFVEGTPMPDPETLPRSLRSLVYRSGITLRHESFTEIVDGRLTQVLEEVLGVTHDDFVVSKTPVPEARSRPSGRIALAAGAVAALAGAAALAAWMYMSPDNEASPAPRARITNLPKPVSQPPTGTLTVQLGALASLEDARREWARLAQEHPRLLGDREFTVMLATVNDKIYFRLRALGFDDTQAQNELCDALKLRGVDCLPWTVK